MMIGLFCSSLLVTASAACGVGTSPATDTGPTTGLPPLVPVVPPPPGLQHSGPIDAISVYVNGFHLYSSDVNRQVEAHHYVTVMSDDLMQAVLYDSTSADASLMGVETIISAQLFDTLPAAEKQLWHSHAYEVKSGLLAAPGLPAHAEQELMNRLLTTYGKTWHTWHTDKHETVPLGVPELMMAPVADGQIRPALVKARDARLGIDTAELARRRAPLPMPTTDKLADSWVYGVFITLVPTRVIPRADHPSHELDEHELDEHE